MLPENWGGEGGRGKMGKKRGEKKQQEEDNNKNLNDSHKAGKK